MRRARFVAEETVEHQSQVILGFAYHTLVVHTTCAVLPGQAIHFLPKDKRAVFPQRINTEKIRDILPFDDGPFVRPHDGVEIPGESRSVPVAP